jgi:hypothetical protein
LGGAAPAARTSVGILVGDLPDAPVLFDRPEAPGIHRGSLRIAGSFQFSPGRRKTRHPRGACAPSRAVEEGHPASFCEDGFAKAIRAEVEAGKVRELLRAADKAFAAQ